MSISFKDGGHWKPSLKQFIKVAGHWTEATQQYIKVGGHWTNITHTPPGFSEDIKTFVHPGVFHTKADLLAVRASISSNAYKKVLNSTEKNRVCDKATAVFNCGSGNAGDTSICDGIVFETKNALYWALRAYAEQNTTYADKAVNIIDSWAKVYVNITGSNQKLLMAWTLYDLARAIEILVHNDYGYTYPQAKLTSAIKYADKLMQTGPLLCETGNNWTSAGMASFQAYWIMKHGVATKAADKTAAIAGFKKWASFTDMLIKIYVYMNTDGALPNFVNFNIAPYNCKPYSEAQLCGVQGWGLKNDGSCFQTNGLIMEYWRDIHHSVMGLNYIGAVFEMAFIQKYVDYYKKHDLRITAGVEAVYGALLKKHVSGGKYMPTPCAGASTSRTTPKISSYRLEDGYLSVYMKHAREKGWAIPFMEQYYTAKGFVENMSTSKTCYDYNFKAIDI